MNEWLGVGLARRKKYKPIASGSAVGNTPASLSAMGETMQLKSKLLFKGIYPKILLYSVRVYAR